LERVSQLVKSFMRPGDLAGRFGGEEIIVALQSGENDALKIAEGIRVAVEKNRMTSVAQVKAEFQVTLSVGIASTQEFGFEADVLIGHADQALYRAKATGRNKVCAAEKSGVSFEVENAQAA
jgi:diguanylate cyclase (GGDEF)-like protein